MSDSPPAHKVLLIDLENCPSQIQQLQTNLNDFSHVVICYANGSPKVPLDWVSSLAGAIGDNKLRLVRMGTSGKNAADFGICFFAGALMQELSKDTHFIIVSNDTDLDHAVGLLRNQGRTAERVGARIEKPESAPLSPADNPPELASFCGQLLKQIKNRPGSEKTLMNSLRTACGKNPSRAEIIFKALISASAIKIDNGKLSYNDAQLKVLSNAVNK